MKRTAILVLLTAGAIAVVGQEKPAVRKAVLEKPTLFVSDKISVDDLNILLAEVKPTRICLTPADIQKVDEEALIQIYIKCRDNLKRITLTFATENDLLLLKKSKVNSLPVFIEPKKKEIFEVTKW